MEKDSKNCKIAFRMDDICSTMNWGNFYRVVEILNDFQIKPLLGVVPHCEDQKLCCDRTCEDFFNIMRRYKRDGFLIAQHGYNHIYVNDNGGILKINRQSEFAGLSVNEQIIKIKAGKAILDEQGLSTDIFMAPAHSYDINTLKALMEVGFRYVTDGYTNKNYEYAGIVFIPCRDVVSLKRKMKGIVTICIHANSLKNEDFNRLRLFIKKYSKYCVDYKELMLEKSDYPCWRINQQIGLMRIRLYKLLNKTGITEILHKLVYER